MEVFHSLFLEYLLYNFILLFLRILCSFGLHVVHSGLHFHHKVIINLNFYSPDLFFRLLIALLNTTFLSLLLFLPSASLIIFIFTFTFTFSLIFVFCFEELLDSVYSSHCELKRWVNQRSIVHEYLLKFSHNFNFFRQFLDDSVTKSKNFELL
jgi:hypothetical protein